MCAYSGPTVGFFSIFLCRFLFLLLKTCIQHCKENYKIEFTLKIIIIIHDIRMTRVLMLFSNLNWI